jgi:hypothetical protein
MIGAVALGWSILLIVFVYKWLTRPVRNRESHAGGETSCYKADFKGTSAEFWRNLAVLWTLGGVAAGLLSLCTRTP